MWLAKACFFKKKKEKKKYIYTLLTNSVIIISVAVLMLRQLLRKSLQWQHIWIQERIYIQWKKHYLNNSVFSSADD